MFLPVRPRYVEWQKSLADQRRKWRRNATDALPKHQQEDLLGGGGQQPLSYRPPPPPDPPHTQTLFLQSMDLVRPKGGFPTAREWPKSVRCLRVMWAQSKSGSVGYIQTRTSTGLVVNHYAAAMAPKGISRLTWHSTRKHFSLSPPFWSYAPMSARQSR